MPTRSATTTTSDRRTNVRGAPSPPATPALVYLYGLLRRPRRPPAATLPPGVPGGGAPRVVAVGDGIWAVASTVSEAEFGEREVERRLRDPDWVAANAFGHERVLDALLRRGPVVPMRMLTLFTDEQRMIDALARRQRAVEAAFDALGDAVEWGVRVIGGRATARALPAVASGRDYLRAKLAAKQALEHRHARLDRMASAVHRQLSAAVQSARRRREIENHPGSAVCLDAAYLVPRNAVGAFTSEVAEVARRLEGEGAAVQLSGPWPPYNFVSALAAPGRRAAKGDRGAGTARDASA